MLTTNFIYSKMIERMSWLNDSDATPGKARISPNDRPLRLVVSAAIRTARSAGASWIQSAIALAECDVRRMEGHDASIPAPDRRPDQLGERQLDELPETTSTSAVRSNLNNRQVNGTAFDTTAFDTKSADAFQYHIRTFSTTFGNLRADGINQLDMSMLKRFNLGESRRFELRGEHVQCSQPPGIRSAQHDGELVGFGTITATVNRFRTLQLVARFYF